VLYVCATPIGNLDDVSPRVLSALRDVELIAAEDTRHTRGMLSRFDIHTPLTSLFTHNEAEKTERVLELLRQGRPVALVTDAGMPGVSDPGLRLVARAIAEGLPLTVLPGPSAVLTALVASGLASDEGFRFVGYLPRRARDLERCVKEWRRCGGVVIAFDSPRRVARSLDTLAALAPEAPAALCRELTKIHEQVLRASLHDLAILVGAQGEIRGEVTLVIDLGAPEDETSRAHTEAGAAVAALLARGLSRRDAAAALHICLGVPRRDAFRLAQEGAEGADATADR
jgi:16S rRNA (cytidine1402-2'-O)-methyltransferase